jgi:hypothetical protein
MRAFSVAPGITSQLAPTPHRAGTFAVALCTSLSAVLSSPLDCALLVGDGDTDWLVRIERGAVTRITRGPLIMPKSDLRLRAASESWARFLEPVPPPGYHDLFALRRYKRIQIEGDIRLLSAYLFYFKRLFALLRKA